MSWQTGILATLVVLLGGLQYGLMVYTMSDLRRRPTVRGDNKTLWAILILTLPFAGALLYASMGPTSFRNRPTPARRPTPRRPGSNEHRL